jgi:hypothetical protein
VLSTWRAAIGPELLQGLQEMVLDAARAEHDEHDYRTARVGDLRLGGIDGTVTRMRDTPANRAAFGSAGTADDPAPYPQLRDLVISDASTRAELGVVTGPSGGDKAEAEQALPGRALKDCPRLFTPDRGPVHGADLPVAVPGPGRQEHAAWITATGLVRAVARHAAPAAKGRRAGQPVHPREISFTACRRITLAAIRHGTATASLPGQVIAVSCRAAIAAIGKRRVQAGRSRHRDHTTKARQGFPNAPRGITTRTAVAEISICAPAAA